VPLPFEKLAKEKSTRIITVLSYLCTGTSNATSGNRCLRLPHVGLASFIDLPRHSVDKETAFFLLF
jgi:hypothetical protein